MNAVFERFVREAIREQLQLPPSAFPSGNATSAVHLDRDRQVPLEPDLSWWERGACVFVGDCKYKRTTGSVPNADVYQMLAYLTALGLPEGLLVYAAGEDVLRDVNIDAAGKRIHVRTLDIAQPPSVVLRDIKKLAQLVRQLRARDETQAAS